MKPNTGKFRGRSGEEPGKSRGWSKIRGRAGEEPGKSRGVSKNRGRAGHGPGIAREPGKDRGWPGESRGKGFPGENQEIQDKYEKIRWNRRKTPKFIKFL